MSKKDKKNSVSTAGKALALGTALSLGTFGFTAIGTGAAFGAPTANTATASTNTTKVIKLANGKTRIRVDLADNLRGKTVFITTTRLVNGKAVKVTLGKIKLTKAGKGFLTVSRKIGLGDRLMVNDGIKNIVNSKVSVIDDTRYVAVTPPVVAPPASGGGGSSSSPAVSTTFTVTTSGSAGSEVIAFGGTATGDVTVTENTGVVTFTRGGVEASTKPNTADLNAATGIPNPGSDKLVLSTAVFAAINAALPADANLKLAAASTAAADLNTIDANTSVAVDATAITALTGAGADVKTALAAPGITTVTDASLPVTASGGSISVADINTINSDTATGDLTASALEDDAATLVGLTTTGTDAITVAMVAASTGAVDLNSIDAATSVAVDATVITELTGLAAAIATAISSAGINTAGDVLATVDAGVAAAADLNTIDTNTTFGVDAIAVTSVVGSSADITALVAAGTATDITVGGVTTVTFMDVYEITKEITFNTDPATTFASSTDTDDWAFDAVNGIVYSSDGAGTSDTNIDLSVLGTITTVTGF